MGSLYLLSAFWHHLSLPQRSSLQNVLSDKPPDANTESREFDRSLERSRGLCCGEGSFLRLGTSLDLLQIPTFCYVFCEKTWVSMVKTFFISRGSTSYPKKRGYLGWGVSGTKKTVPAWMRISEFSGNNVSLFFKERTMAERNGKGLNPSWRFREPIWVCLIFWEPTVGWCFFFSGKAKGSRPYEVWSNNNPGIIYSSALCLESFGLYDGGNTRPPSTARQG